MTKLNEIYKSNADENIVEVVHSDDGGLVCGGYPMVLLTGNTVNVSVEKHKPIIEKSDYGIIVKVGKIPHPMEAKHYIEFIEVISGERVNRLYLNPGEKPQAVFCLDFSEDIIARAYCNIHGLWTN